MARKYLDSTGLAYFWNKIKSWVQGYSASKEDLAQKQDTLTDGVNIKTINNESILGSGNVTIQGDDTIVILDEQTTNPTDITNLKKLYRRDEETISNILQPSYVHTDGTNISTEAQIVTNNIQVTQNNISSFFDNEFSQVVREIYSINEYVFSFRVIENDVPISAIRLGTSNNIGSITITPTGTNTTLYIGKYFYINYETKERVYNTLAEVIVNGTTYTFDSDDEILEIESTSTRITIENTGNGRVILYSINTQKDPYDEWELRDLDTIIERQKAVSGLRKDLLEDHINPIEDVIDTHSTDIQTLKTGVRNLGNDLIDTNNRIGNIKVDGINRLPIATYEYLNQIYRVDGKYYECYISVPGNAQYFEWPFSINGTSEITESNWGAFASEIGNGFLDHVYLNEYSKFYRNSGSVKLGSSSSVGYVDFNINLTEVHKIEIDYSGYNNKISHIIITINGNVVLDSNISGTERQTYSFEQTCNNPDIKIETLRGDGIADSHATIYGIRVHTGAPATYAWHEINDGSNNNVFWAEVDVTTFAEIQDAIDAGRTVMLKDEDGYIYVFIYIDDTCATFSFSSGEERFIKTYNVSEDDSWELLYINGIESQNNRVNSISSSSDDDHYPSAYAVYQALQSYTPTSNLAPVATSGDYDDLTNKPTIPTVPTNVSAFTNDVGYLTEHQDLSNYIQKSQTAGLLKNDGTIDTNTYLTQHQSLSGYATETWVEQQNYLTQHQDISGKADKVSNATNGNFAGLDSNGNLVDSGYSSSSFITQHQSIPEYTVEKLALSESGYSSSYVLKKNNIQVGATINIPKDMVVSNGEIRTVDTIDVPYQGAQVGDKYIELTIANTEQNKIYIPVKDLVDVYTEGNGININSSNVVSIKIDQLNSNGLSVDENGLSLSTVTTTSSGAMSSSDKSKLDGIASGAEVNIQSDWNQTNISADDYIKNKPTNVSVFNNDAGYLTQHQDISGKADKVTSATTGNLASLDSNGNLTDSGVSSSDVIIKSNTSGLIKNDGTIDTTQYGTLSNILIPNFDEVTPIETIDFDIAATSYYKLFTRANSNISSEMSEVNDLLLFRITCTGTGIYAKYDFSVKFRNSLYTPLVVVNCSTYSVSAATTGLYIIRFQYPKALDNGYDWLCDFRAYNATARHIKVEIFATTENITWFDSPVVTDYNSTYQSDGSFNLYDRRGLVVNGTLYTNAITASTAGYITGYNPKYINGSIIRAGEALVVNNLCYVNNGYAFKISNKNNSIDPDYGINMSGTNYSIYSYMAYMHFRAQTGCSFAADTNLTYDPLLIGNRVYLRCKLIGDKIYSDSHLSTEMTPGYTWYLLGTVQTTTVISISTFGSMFITLDESGMISHINGKPTQSVLMNGNYKKYFYNSAISNVNSIAKLDYIKGNSLVFNQIINDIEDSTDGWIKNVNTTVISASDGVISAYSPSGAAYFGVNTTSTNGSVEIGHLYFCSIYVKATKTMNVYAPYIATTYITLQQKVIDPQPLGTDWERFTCLVLGKGNGNPSFGIRNYNAAVGEATLYVKGAMMIDLTKMFGPGNEPQDMNVLMEMFPLEYYNYNLNGTLLTGEETGFLSKDSNDNILTNLSIPITTLTGIANGGSESEVIFPYGLNGIGNIKDEINFTTGKAVKRTERRLYENGDSSSSSLITDGITTIYTLQTSIEYTLDTIPTVEYETKFGGTEQWLPINTSTPTIAPISCISSYYNNSSIPIISTNIVSDADSDTKTVSPKAVYDEIHPEISNTEPSGGMIPNIMYNFGELTGNTTFTLAAPTDNSIVNHYYFCFDTPSTTPTVVWPSGLTWYGGSDPTIMPSKHYEVSIINNIACYMEV